MRLKNTLRRGVAAAVIAGIVVTSGLPVYAKTWDISEGSITVEADAGSRNPGAKHLWRAGQAHAGRAKRDISETVVPCYRDSQQLDKVHLSKSICPL